MPFYLLLLLLLHYLHIITSLIPIAIADAMTARISAIQIVRQAASVFTGIEITGVTGGASSGVLGPAIADVLIIVSMTPGTT